MARGSSAGSEVYVGMLGVATFAMLAGVVCLLLEATEYEWTTKPAAAVTAPKLPDIKPLAMNEPDAPTAVAAQPTEPATEPKPAATLPELPKTDITAKPAEEPKPLPKTTVPAAAPEKQPDGPIPSPVQIRPRRSPLPSPFVPPPLTPPAGSGHWSSPSA